MLQNEAYARKQARQANNTDVNNFFLFLCCYREPAEYFQKYGMAQVDEHRNQNIVQHYTLNSDIT